MHHSIQDQDYGGQTNKIDWTTEHYDVIVTLEIIINISYIPISVIGTAEARALVSTPFTYLKTQPLNF